MRTFSFPSSKLKEVPDRDFRVDNKSREVRTQPTQVFLFVGYEFHLDSALVKLLTHPEKWLNFQDLILHLKSNMFFDFRMFDVANWVAFLYGENGPGGTPSHEAPFQFHLKEHWRYPQSLHSLLPWTGSFPALLE